MSSKAIKEKPEPGAPLGWKPQPEAAPSVMLEDEPRLFRLIGFIGLLFLTVGGLALVLYLTTAASRLVGPVLGSCFTVIGLACLLFHAARDADMQIRRTYLVFGLAWVLFGIVMSALPRPGEQGVTLFLPWGFLSFLAGVLFLLPSTRSESDPTWRRGALAVLGVGGAILALTGLIGANVSGSFLLPIGLLLAMLGLAYLWAFIGLRGVADDVAYRVGLGMGAVGAIVFLVALGRSVLPPLFASWHWVARASESYFASTGMLLMVLGALYMALSLALCSDHRLAVLTRRELAAFFYSPIAYFVLFGFTIIAAFQYGFFVFRAYAASNPEGFMAPPRPMVEPIIAQYIISLVPAMVMLGVVPMLTMRLLSEEKRAGTLEVLLTAPIGETSIVLSKFLAALVFFMLTWVPYGLFLIALRVGTGEGFDYRPILSFSLGLLCSGAGFVSMGLFFSALTRNQIVAFVLTFMGMIALIALYLINLDIPESSAWHSVLTSVSFIDQWISTLQGKLSVRDVVVPISSAVFWLFLTVKALEARKWQ
jgi:ABC-type transport system involved in multi-copper enzyme maturation permease subunit